MSALRLIAAGAGVVVLSLLLLVPVAHAVQPGEMLDDPALEARAQALDEQLRCVKCRSESIASSNAPWASDARVRVRELIADGAGDQDVRDFFVARYGEYVLMRPKAEGANWLLWLAGPIMLLIAVAVAGVYLARRRRAWDAGVTGLTAQEEARLRQLTDE